MSQDTNLLAAAELADRYIEIILSTSPELLVGAYVTQEAEDEDGESELVLDAISHRARALAEFRQQLIDNLSEQPLPEAEDD